MVAAIIVARIVVEVVVVMVFSYYYYHVCMFVLLLLLLLLYYLAFIYTIYSIYYSSWQQIMYNLSIIWILTPHRCWVFRLETVDPVRGRNVFLDPPWRHCGRLSSMLYVVSIVFVWALHTIHTHYVNGQHCSIVVYILHPSSGHGLEEILRNSSLLCSQTR